MQILLIRHGEKSHPNRDDFDTYLSAHGLAQSQKLKNLVLQGQLVKPDFLYASEIERTQQTLKPLGDALGLSIFAKREFDLQNYNENSDSFQSRVKKGLSFLEQLAISKDATIFCCTHQDWLQEAMGLIHVSPSLASLDSWPTTRYILFQLDISLGEQPIWTIKNEGRVLW